LHVCTPLPPAPTAASSLARRCPPLGRASQLSARHVTGCRLAQETRIHNACRRGPTMRVHDVAANGPGRCFSCSPRHSMPLNSRDEGSECVSITWRAAGLADITRACHVIGCHFTQETRVRMRVDNAAGNGPGICFCCSPRHMVPVDSQETRGQSVLNGVE
jgi:hypothetical protein